MRKARTPLLKFLLRSLNQAIEKNDYQSSAATFHDPSRRRFVKNATKAALVTGLASNLPLISCNVSTSKRIAIVGGGIAGLHCAYLLKKAGIKSTIYEADRRVGGRIKSKLNIFADNMSTELGGEFIDANHSDMLNLVKAFDLQLLDTYEDEAVRDTFYFEGSQKSEEEVVLEFQKAIPTILADLESCGEDYDTESAYLLDQLQLEEYFRKLGCADWLVELLDRAYMAEFGLDCREQSSLNFISMIGLETSDGFDVFGESDERYKVKGGNQQIVDRLAENLVDQIQYNHYLSSISHRNNVYTLTFKNNETIKADLVVMTIPFSILRTIEMDIPEMSEVKLACIKELGYGQNNKVMLSMASRPWRKNQPASAGYLMHPTIHNGWDNGHMQNENDGPTGYTIFLGGSPSVSLAKVVKQTDTNDRIPDGFAELHAKSLEGVYPGTIGAYNRSNYAAMWSNNPYVLASYSCYKVGQWSTIAGYEMEPVGNLYFAGEHCSTDFQGYMNGAAQTGRIVADEILKVLKE